MSVFFLTLAVMSVAKASKLSEEMRIKLATLSFQRCNGCWVAARHIKFHHL